VSELIADKTRAQALREMGVYTKVLAALPVQDGIEAVRMLLPRCWFDAEKCVAILSALVLAEKLVPRWLLFSRLAGVAILAWGTVLLLRG
jgi:hypothetical protein